MQCSVTTLSLCLLTLTGTGMYVIAGWLALDGTLSLFKEYGPAKGRGNPALDDPPEYWVNPNTNKWEPVNYNERGNWVPQVFRGIQYYLIALSIFMFGNVIAFTVDSFRSKKAVNNLNYSGKKTSINSISCTGWLAGYVVFLCAMWLVMACFGVLPLVEYVITKQRCEDLGYDKWSPMAKREICIDLVQYGLVFFKETSDTGFGKLCGRGRIQPGGNLEGFCENYYPNFSLYITSFVGACIVILSMVLFGYRQMSNLIYLKVRRWENPSMMMGPPPPSARHSDAPYGNYVKSLHNPNYEHNVLLLDPNHVPSNVDIESYERRSPGSDIMEMKERHYGNGDYRNPKNSKRYSRSTAYSPDDSVPPYGHSTKRRRVSDGSMDSRQFRDPGRRPASRREPRRRSISSDDDSDFKPRRHDVADNSDIDYSSDHTRSTIGFRPKPMKRKSRSTKSDPNIFRKSQRRNSRRKPPIRNQYDSPPSDYYMQEDMERRSYRSKSRLTSEL